VPSEETKQAGEPEPRFSGLPPELRAPQDAPLARLIAFAPLEAGLSEKDVLDQARFLVGFLGGGFLVFGLALVLEWRFLDVD
jgi:hypothetical protein